MRNLQPPIELANRQNEEYVEFMLSESISFKEEDDFTDVSSPDSKISKNAFNMTLLLVVACLGLIIIRSVL